MARRKQVMEFSAMNRNVMLIVIVFLMVLTATGLEKKKLMDVEVSGRYLTEGDIGGGLRFRFNLPEGLFLSFSVSGGQILDDMNNWAYIDDDELDLPIDQYFFFDSDISEGSLGGYIGYQFLEDKKVSPFIMAGLGGWFANFQVFRAETVTVPDGEGYRDIVSKVDKKIATEFAGIVPLRLGADIRLLDWLYVCPQVGYDIPMDELNIYAQPFDSTRIENPIDLNEKRGKLLFGLSIKIPIYIEMY